MKLFGEPLTLRCPEHGLLSLRCSHEELKAPRIGKAMMMVGGFIAGLGFLEVTGIVR